MLRLPLALATIFEDWLEREAPQQKEKVLNRIRAVRGNRLDDARFGARMRGEGFFAEQTAQLFAVAARKVGLALASSELSTSAFRRPGGTQLELGV